MFKQSIKLSFLFLLIGFLFSCSKSKPDQLQLEANAINENFSLDLYVYGDFIEDKYNLDKIYIDNIRNVQVKSKYNIILFNPTNILDLKDADYELLEELINNGIVIYFKGIENYIEQLKSSLINEYLKLDQHKTGHYIVDFKNEKTISNRDGRGISSIIANLTSYLKIIEGENSI